MRPSSRRGQWPVARPEAEPCRRLLRSVGGGSVERRWWPLDAGTKKAGVQLLRQALPALALGTPLSSCPRRAREWRHPKVSALEAWGFKPLGMWGKCGMPQRAELSRGPGHCNTPKRPSQRYPPPPAATCSPNLLARVRTQSHNTCAACTDVAPPFRWRDALERSTPATAPNSIPCRRSCMAHS